jgi:hypothetical protein
MAYGVLSALQDLLGENVTQQVAIKLLSGGTRHGSIENLRPEGDAVILVQDQKRTLIPVANIAFVELDADASAASVSVADSPL